MPWQRTRAKERGYCFVYSSKILQLKIRCIRVSYSYTNLREPGINYSIAKFGFKEEVRLLHCVRNDFHTLSHCEKSARLLVQGCFAAILFNNYYMVWSFLKSRWDCFTAFVRTSHYQYKKISIYSLKQTLFTKIWLSLNVF